MAVKALEERPIRNSLFHYPLATFQPWYVKPSFWNKFGPIALLSSCWVRNLPEAKATVFSLKATICGILGQSQTTERGGNSWKILSSSSRRELRLVDVLFLSLNPEHLIIVCFRYILCQELFDQTS